MFFSDIILQDKMLVIRKNIRNFKIYVKLRKIYGKFQKYICHRFKKYTVCLKKVNGFVNTRIKLH